jgi:hypothetical protein
MEYQNSFIEEVKDKIKNNIGMQDTTLGSDYVSESDSNVLSCIPVNSRFSYQQINNVDLPVPAANQLWSTNEKDILLGLKKKKSVLREIQNNQVWIT